MFPAVVFFSDVLCRVPRQFAMTKLNPNIAGVESAEAAVRLINSLVQPWKIGSEMCQQPNSNSQNSRPPLRIASWMIPSNASKPT